MSFKINATRVDAVLDSVGDDESPGTALADLVDENGDWDWSDESEHGPEDRLAVLESSGAYWLVYRGSEDDDAKRFATEDEANEALKDKSEQIAG